MAHAEDPVTSEPRPGSAVVDCPFRYVKLGRIDDWCPQYFPFHSPHSLLFRSSPDGRSNTVSKPQVLEFMYSICILFFTSLFFISLPPSLPPSLSLLLHPSLPLSLSVSSLSLSLSLTLPLFPLLPFYLSSLSLSSTLLPVSPSMLRSLIEHVL